MVYLKLSAFKGEYFYVYPKDTIVQEKSGKTIQKTKPKQVKKIDNGNVRKKIHLL